MKKIISILISFALTSSALYAQKPLSLDNVFHQRALFPVKSVPGIKWIRGGEGYSSLSDNAVHTYQTATGKAGTVAFDGNSVRPAISIVDYEYSADENKLLLLTEYESIYRHSFRGKYYVYDLITRQLQSLTEEGHESYATFSPDGKKVGFVRDNNLYYVTLSDMAVAAVTNDGAKNSIINGATDWVYEEEFGFPNAFYWSPDSKKIAYYRFDETAVKEYSIQVWTARKDLIYPDEYRFKYPKAGEQNASVNIYIYHLDKKAKVKAHIDLHHKSGDYYIPRVQWTSQANTLSVRKMDRLQNRIDFLHVDAASGKSTIVHTEKNGAFTDINYTDDLIYLRNTPQFIISSERNGWKNLYLYDFSGKLLNPITQGADWEVTSFINVNEKTGTVYYLSTEDGHLNRTLYAVKLNGKKKTKLSHAQGIHKINMSPNGDHYIDFFNVADQPLSVSLYQTHGNKKVSVLANNDTLKEAYASYGITNKEFFTYPAADKTTSLDGYFIKPANFDPAKQYPVLVYQYSGPRISVVDNSFGTGGNYIWFQYLAQQGILVAVVDTRGTGFRGEHFTKQTYKNLGKLETEDLLAAAQYLGSLPYVDKTKLGLHGWSYGGFMTAMVMTHQPSVVYKAGIAGAAVTDFRLYDNIYTERYMQTPELNTEGYSNNPVNAAAGLKGDFLLIHGTGDDNVHFQNAVLLENALINAGKQFRTFYYPDQAHSFQRPAANHHLITLMTDFLIEKLK